MRLFFYIEKSSVYKQNPEMNKLQAQAVEFIFRRAPFRAFKGLVVAHQVHMKAGQPNFHHWYQSKSIFFPLLQAYFGPTPMQIL